MTRYTAVLDTMILLHFRPVEEIDWRAVLGAARGDHVEVLITGITLREVDDHKNHTPKLRERARRVSKQLNDLLAGQGARLANGVTVRGALRQPALNDPTLGLDRSVNDDVLVGAALEYQAANPDSRVVLVTTDTYPATRARDLDLEVAEPGEAYMLPLEQDPAERRVKELERELQAVQAARPRLGLRFAGGTNSRSVELEIPPLLTDEGIELAVADAARALPPGDKYRQVGAKSLPPDHATHRQADSGKLAAIDLDSIGAMGVSPASAAEVARYEEERTAYLSKLRKHLGATRQALRTRACYVPIDLEVTNVGSAPANDLDVYVHVPDGVWVTQTEPPVVPKGPRPPTPPRTSLQVMADALRMQGGVFGAHPQSSYDFMRDLAHVSRAPANVSGFMIKKSNSYDLRWHVGRVKHHHPVKLTSFYVVVPEGPVQPLQMAYEIHAADVPEPVVGTLNLILCLP